MVRRRRVAPRLASCILAAATAAGCGNDDAVRARDTEGVARREQLRMQFASVQSRLRQVQAQALDSPGVQAAQEEFYAALRTRMVEIDSASADLLDRASAVGDELARLTGPALATREEKERVAEELQMVERLLRPIQDSAFLNPEVSARFRVLQDSLVATIRRIDPGSEALLDRMSEIEQEIAALDRGAGTEPGGWVPGGSSPPAPAATTVPDTGGADGAAPD